ncbi:MAG: hypothetical protein IPP35_00560 [Elusimicrobia bacterium]|nr:hypothetical protein [Elusimicrobiota bacterium]
MNRGRWARRGWRVTDFLKVGVIGLGVLFSFSLAFAIEYTDGTYNITRSDINGEGAINADDGSVLLQGSIGTVDVGTSSYSGGRHLGGIQGNLYYPSIPTSFQPVPLSVTSTSFKVNWLAPGSGIKSDIRVNNYQLRQRTTPMNQANFDSSTDVPASFSAVTTGTLHPDITVPGLSYNTVYYIGLEALDSDFTKNRSYLTTTSACTLAPEITNVSYATDYDNKLIAVSFNPNNPRSDALDFEGRLSTTTSFILAQTLTQAITDNNATSVTLPDFNSLDRNKTWYFQARAKNQAGAYTPWYPAVPVAMVFQNAIPTATMAASEVYVTSATLRWNVAGLPAGNQYQAEASSDNFFTVSRSALLPNTQPYYRFPFLDDNQAYKFRVQVFDNVSSPVGYSSEISAVTSVFRPTAVQAFDVFQTSATAIWSWSGAPRAHSFKVDISSISPSSGFLSAGADVNTNITPYPLNSLQINTPYYIKVTALNSSGVPSAQGPGDVATFFTQAVPPGPLGIMVPPDPRHQISFSWTHNGNNPLSRYRAELSRDSAFSTVLASTDLPSGQVSHMFENVNPLVPGDPVLANDEHFVRVRTLQASNGSPLDPPVTGNSITAPLAPVLISVTRAVRDLAIQWTDESGTIKNSPNTQYRSLVHGFVFGFPAPIDLCHASDGG